MKIGAQEASSARSWKDRTIAAVSCEASPLLKREKILKACALREIMHVPRVYAEVFHQQKDGTMQVTASDASGRLLSTWKSKPCERIGIGRIKLTLRKVDYGYDLQKRLSKVSYVTHLMSESDPSVTSRNLKLLRRFFMGFAHGATFFKKVYLAVLRAFRYETRTQIRRAKLCLGYPLLRGEKSSGLKSEVLPKIWYKPFRKERSGTP